LKAAVYTGIGSEQYGTSYSYDKHGNMLTLTRRGNVNSSALNGMVDNLTMVYTGNQLTKATDTGENVAMSGSMDFKDYSNVAIEYIYNRNGAMTKDLNKGISDIQYNSLNLPRMMDIKSPIAEARNEYLYSAGGQKLKTVQKWNPNYSTAPVIGSAVNAGSLTVTKTTDYVGNKVYENNALKRILVDGGYIEAGVYYYYLASHLGNNHVVAKQDGTSVQSISYYPFGMHFAPGVNTAAQPYLYNNKELDQMHGLNLYDYHARQYESAIGRFTTIDPKAESFYSWSPYAYVMNNPINAVDLRGDSVWFTIDNNIATMHVTAKVINMSSDNINMGRAATDIGKGIANAFGGKFEVDGKTYTMKTDIQISAVTSMDEVSTSDHLFVLSDKIKSADIPGRAATNEMGGKVMSVWSGDFADNDWLSNNFSHNNTRSTIHEFGHALGLSHESASGWRNLMEQSRSGKNVTSGQRTSIIYNYQQGYINRGSNSMMIRGIKRPNPSYIYLNTDKRRFEAVHINAIGLNHKY
jgi:RHS repeat-associated protein